MTDLIVLQNCCTVQLTKGFNALLDGDDYLEVSQRKWHLFRDRKRRAGRGYYVQSHDPGRHSRMHLLHRLLMGVLGDHSMMVDHVNGDGLDNRRSNLRFCTRRLNSANQHPTYRGSSKYKGVHLHLGRWQARVNVAGKRVSLGHYFGEIEAARAYDVMAIKLYGEFARTNRACFPDDFADCLDPPAVLA